MKKEMHDLTHASITGNLRMVKMFLEMGKKSLAREHRDYAIGAAHLAYTLDLISVKERNALIFLARNVFNGKAVIA